jgi:S-adenosylmethionine hydrolase
MSQERLTRGVIVGVDHFGNLISDLPAESSLSFKAPAVKFRGQQIQLRKTYGDVMKGLLAVINSWGTVEIAESQGNAQQTLKAAVGETVNLVEFGQPSI